MTLTYLFSPFSKKAPQLRHPTGTEQTDAYSVVSPNRADDSPLVISCPHDGSYIPDHLRDRLAVSETQLLRRADTHTGILAADNVKHSGATVITSIITPSILNVGRDINCIHPDDVRGGIGHLASDPHSKYLVNAQGKRLGQGLVATKTLIGGHRLYKRNQHLDATEIQDLIDTYYTPFHNRLQDIITEKIKKHGFCLILDLHSCPSKGQPADADHGEKRPDIIISNNDITNPSCHTAIVTEIEQMAQSLGLSTLNNTPYYKGGFITQKYGQHNNPDPVSAILHSTTQTVQIELNRAAYMNERTLEIAPQKYDIISNFMQQTIPCLVKHANTAANIKNLQMRAHLKHLPTHTCGTSTQIRQKFKKQP